MPLLDAYPCRKEQQAGGFAHFLDVGNVAVAQVARRYRVVGALGTNQPFAERNGHAVFNVVDIEGLGLAKVLVDPLSVARSDGYSHNAFLVEPCRSLHKPCQ